MLNKYVFVYLDDILIFSRSFSEYVQHVRSVLQRLLENQLFHQDSKSFLGLVISKKGFKLYPSKATAVEEWPTPQSHKDLQRFLGFANFYRRFVRNCNSLVAPLASISVRFIWNDAANKAFKDLKSHFPSTSMLTTTDPTSQFIVEMDASKAGVGAVLSQRSLSDGKVRPCAFFYHRLSASE